MPVCLIQSLPGTRYSLTDSLTVVLPDREEEGRVGMSVGPSKDVREGRVSWHSSDIKESREAFSFQRLGQQRDQWRARGLFSFLEVALRSPLGGEEMSALSRLKQSADWLILDAASAISLPKEALQIERWEAQAQLMRTIDKRVGLRMVVDSALPLAVQALWITKLALVFGEPGFLFLEFDSVGASVTFLREVQNRLSDHPLSKGAARLIPVLRSKTYVVGGQSLEVFDLGAIDGLYIESCRPFFGGVAIDRKTDTAFLGKTLWSLITEMVSEKCSVATVFDRLDSFLHFVPRAQRWPLIQRTSALLYQLSSGEPPAILSAKNDLEGFFRECVHELFPEGTESVAYKTLVDGLLGQANSHTERTGAHSDRRSTFVGSFVGSI